MRNQRLLTVFFSWLIIAFSFLNFSAWYYPLLNTDMAVGILMAPGYTAPGDLYYWGQTHYGSLVSFLAHLLIVTYLFPASLAFSVAHFSILTAGYFSLATLFRSPNSKILLALLWFLPPWHFHDQVISSAGIMMSFLGTGIWALNKSLKPSPQWNRLICLSAASVAFILAVWASDQAVISLLLILGIGIWRLLPLYRKGSLRMIFLRREIMFRIILTLFFTIAGVGFILYAKSRAFLPGLPESFAKASPSIGIRSFFSESFSALSDVFLYKSGNIFSSIFAWLWVAGCLWLVSYSRMRRSFIIMLRNKKWFAFFSMNVIAVFILEIFLRRFFSSFTESYYPAVIYISFWIAFLLYIESTGSIKRKVRTAILYIIVIPGVLSSFLPFYLPERVEPRLKTLSELKQLNNAGIIGSYDNAYPIACADPKTIHATPNDSDFIRNPQFITDVLKQPAIYIARDGWISGYPDTVRQFGQILLKEGDEFLLGGLSLCRYEKYIYSETFGPARMKFQGDLTADTLAVSGGSVMISKEFDRSRHFVFGPYIPLKKGKIMLEYRLKGSDNLNTDNAAVLEAAAGYGKKILATKTIRWCDFQKKFNYETFSFTVDIPEDYEGVEFRIMFLGGGELWFDNVKMTGM